MKNSISYNEKRKQKEISTFLKILEDRCRSLHK